MNPVIRELINQKIEQLTVKELIRHSRKEGIVMTVKDAKRILAVIQEEKFDIGNKKQVNQFKKKLKMEFPQHYDKAMALLKPYEHYLES